MACALLVFSLATVAAPGPPTAVPRLIVQAPPELSALGRTVERFDPQLLEPAIRLTGASDLSPIQVLLAAESSPQAMSAPPWVSGYAIGPASAIVLLPARVPHYPDSDLDALVQHEVTHILIDRAAGGRPVPRWFHEGLAMAAGRGRGLEDRSRTTLAILIDGRIPLADLDSQFAGGQSDVQAAYALAGDFVADLLLRRGPETSAKILSGIARGESFDAAFQAATGESLGSLETSYWRRRTFWNRWVPFLSSTAALWLGITGLALVAFKRRRVRDAELRRRWELEESLKDLQNERDLGSFQEEAPPEVPEEPEELVN
ncbi:MAG TPA: hypothetical protein VGS22_23620 [Thermoanaerobaculia bacterium]|nr:hypothetical protein [Thermoanaerobaculia bacterium]